MTTSHHPPVYLRVRKNTRLHVLLLIYPCIAAIFLKGVIKGRLQSSLPFFLPLRRQRILPFRLETGGEKARGKRLGGPKRARIARPCALAFRGVESERAFAPPNADERIYPNPGEQKQKSTDVLPRGECVGKSLRSWHYLYLFRCIFIKVESS